MGFERITNDGVKKGEIKKCIVCGNEFFARQSNYVCCSTECSRMNNLIKHYEWQGTPKAKTKSRMYYEEHLYNKSNTTLSFEEYVWVYEKWRIGYSKKQIANALFVTEEIIINALNGRKKNLPRLVYERH